MKFEIYCDESNPDVFWSKSRKRAKYSFIGGLWLHADQRQILKDEIKKLKEMYEFHSEIKWHRANNRHEAFYKALIDLYLDFNRRDLLRFRCIAIEADKIDLVRFHENDAELGFYKFYYQMLIHWIDDFNEYQIFCDEKTTRVGNRLKTLHRVLSCSNITSSISAIQALPSKEVVLLQLTDFLLGIASSRINESVSQGSVKDSIIQYMENGLKIDFLRPTAKGERQFNIFKINLSGGW
jgi:hypothetical protein